MHVYIGIFVLGNHSPPSFRRMRSINCYRSATDLRRICCAMTRTRFTSCTMRPGPVQASTKCCGGGRTFARAPGRELHVYGDFECW